MTDALITTGAATRVADVEQKLTELWSQVAGGDAALMRATTLNLIIYTDLPDEAIKTLACMSEGHPCRAIVIVPATIKTDGFLEAIPLLLQRPGFGREARAQIICEVIKLTVSGDAHAHISSTVRSLLLTDQPVYLLREGRFSPTDPALKDLWGTLDGLLFDSANIGDAEVGLRAALAARDVTHFNGLIYDLNWLRLTSWCKALAQQFDPLNERVGLTTTNSVEITHKNARAAALLMFGWLADRLKWHVMSNDQADVWTVRSSIGAITLRLKTVTSAPVGLHKITIGTQTSTYSAEYIPQDSCIVLQSEGHTAVVPNLATDECSLLNMAFDRAELDGRYERVLTLAVALSAGADTIGQRAGMIVVKDSDALARLAARETVQIARHSIKRNGRFTVALSGGSTPRILFELLAQAPYREQIPWAQTHIFCGDERDVATDHPDSNQRMAHEALLDKVPLPPGNIHGILTGQLNAADAAERYAAELRAFFELNDAELPQFDLVLLGLGDDGHTASLFPHTEALHAKGEALFVANVVPQLNTTRLTLTADVINRAANVIFLVAGEKKAGILYDVVRGPYKPEDHPSQLIHPAEGALTIMTDQAAATRLRADMGAE